MNKLKKSLLVGSILATSLLPLKVIAQNDENFDYARIGMTIKRFNNTNVDKQIEGLPGFELGYGKKITKDIRSEIYSSFVKKKNKDLEIGNLELGTYFDYNPSGFYVGLGPKISYLELKRSKDFESIFGYGLAGRIGYSPKISKDLKLYLELNYSKLAHKENDEILDLGTIGVSFGMEF